MRRKLLIAMVLLLALILAERREFLFINLNYQIDHVSRNTPFSYAHSEFRSFVNGWSQDALISLKWAVSCAYVLVNGFLAVALARLLHGHSRYTWPIVIIIGSLSLAALTFHVLGRYFTGCSDIGVKLLHTVQYPVVLLVLLVSTGLGRLRKQAD